MLPCQIKFQVISTNGSELSVLLQDPELYSNTIPFVHRCYRLKRLVSVYRVSKETIYTTLTFALYADSCVQILLWVWEPV